MKKILLLLIIVLNTSAVFTQPITPATPESAGFSSGRLERIDKLIKEYVDKNWIAGASAIIVKDGKIIYHKGTGYNDNNLKTSIPKDGIFRIASQTKAITSVAVMILYEEGKLLLDDPLSKYIPEFRKQSVLDKFNKQDSSYTTVSSKREVTIRHLLNHTSGIDYPGIGSESMQAIYTKADIPSGIATGQRQLSTEMKKLAALPLAHHPGEKWTYGLNTDVLGYLVEVVSGMSFDKFLTQRIFEPLGMKDTYFYLPKEKQNRLLTLYTEDSLKKLVKNTDKNADFPNKPGTFLSGGAGLSSTLYDYAVFLQMLLNGGIYNGNRILSPAIVRMMTSNQIGDLNLGSKKFGLGFGIATERTTSQEPVSEGTYDWGGYFGSNYWVDPKQKLIGMIMTQQVPNSHGDLMTKFKVLVYSALE